MRRNVARGGAEGASKAKIKVQFSDKKLLQTRRKE